jgi:hypothetical protein
MRLLARSRHVRRLVDCVLRQSVDTRFDKSRTRFKATVSARCRTFNAALIAVVLGQSAAAAQQDWHIRVDDPRPLATAVKHVETLCSCIVTYEDPRWTRDEHVGGSAGVIAGRCVN